MFKLQWGRGGQRKQKDYTRETASLSSYEYNWERRGGGGLPSLLSMSVLCSSLSTTSYPLEIEVAQTLHTWLLWSKSRVRIRLLPSPRQTRQFKWVAIWDGTEAVWFRLWGPAEVQKIPTDRKYFTPVGTHYKGQMPCKKCCLHC